MNQYQLILGSKSPRRKELLESLGFNFKIRVVETDELFPENLTPAEIVSHISYNKAMAIPFENENELVLTCDTLVFCDDHILAKPEHIEHAIEMLSMLSGRVHQVYSGVTLRTAQGFEQLVDVTHVHFLPLDLPTIQHYAHHFPILDKAGAYGIQDWIGLVGVHKIEGSYTNVMGLPTQKLYPLLKNKIK